LCYFILTFPCFLIQFWSHLVILRYQVFAKILIELFLPFSTVLLNLLGPYLSYLLSFLSFLESQSLKDILQANHYSPFSNYLQVYHISIISKTIVPPFLLHVHLLPSNLGASFSSITFLIISNTELYANHSLKLSSYNMDIHLIYPFFQYVFDLFLLFFLIIILSFKALLFFFALF